MRGTIRNLLIGSGYSLSALIIIKLADVINSIITARLLGPKNLGMFAIIRYLLELLCIFTMVGIPTAMVKFIAESKSNPQLTKVVYTSFVSMIVPAVVVCGIILSVSHLIAHNIYNEPALSVLIKISVVTLLGLTLFAFGNSILQGLQEIKKLSLTMILNSIVSIPVIILLVYYGGLKGAVLSRAIVAFIGVGIAGVIIKKVCANQVLDTRFMLDYNFIKRLLNLAFPTFLSGLVMTPALWIVATRLSITHGFVEVGLFNVAYALMQVILFIPTAVGVPLVPKVSELNANKPEELRRVISTSIYIVGSISLTISIGFAIFSKPILSLLYGEAYVSAWKVLILLSASAFLTSIGYIIGYYLLGVGRMWLGFIFNLIWFLCLITISIPFISNYGAVGIGISYLIAYTLLTIIMLSLMRKEIGLFGKNG